MANPVFRFSYRGHFDDGVVCVNGLHYQFEEPAGGGLPALSDCIDVIDTALRTTYLACLAPSYTVDSAELREELASTDPAIPRATDKVINTVGTGSASDTKLMDAVCAIIKLRTDAAIRSSRGYIAMPSPRSTGSLSSTRQWSGTYLAALQAFAAKLDDDYSIGTAPDDTSVVPVVWSQARADRDLLPNTFQVQEGIPRLDPRWRRSRTTAP